MVLEKTSKRHIYTNINTYNQLEIKNMTKAELTKLYEKIETELDNLKIGSFRDYAHPEFTDAQLMTIPKIIEYLKKNKYKETINVEAYTMRIKVTKVQQKEAEKSPFAPENFTIEKSENEIKAEQAYNNCKSNNHKLVQSKRTTYNTTILTCDQCKLGYTYKLNSGTTKVKSVFPI